MCACVHVCVRGGMNELVNGRGTSSARLKCLTASLRLCALVKMPPSPIMRHKSGNRWCC